MSLEQQLKEKLGDTLCAITVAFEQVTIEAKPDYAHALFKTLQKDAVFQFDTLIDVCGVDYLDYGTSEWETSEVTSVGFSRGVEKQRHIEREDFKKTERPRFAVVYHLLSTTLNHRLRVRIFLPDDQPLILDSVADIWSAANWFEREAYDLFGILFKGHNDLRRILTDYGFIGYPMRKDFPLSGHVEVRYDAELGRVIYEDVDIQPRTLVPKVRRRAHGN